MSDTLYSEWKRGIVVEAFRQRGLSPDVPPLHCIPVASRRRAVFTARRERGGVMLGYHRRRSHTLFNIKECPILVPALVTRLDGIRAVAAVVTRREARLTVLATSAGLDVSVEVSGHVDASAVARLAPISAEHGVARIACNGETVIERARPALSFAGVEVVPPPGAFTQSVAEAGELLADKIVESIGKATHTADLFCGIGTLTFPLARQARVLAVDGDRDAVTALEAAARRVQTLKPIETKVRDLFHAPLSAKELKGFNAVVLDPPRAGARAQAEELARSQVPLVIAVSCNPATLARDVRILVDGGFRIESVTPFDQFLFSAHVEAVAVLRR
jgi:23S rRNA (uracil1939-C5)-methyltransferase